MCQWSCRVVHYSQQRMLPFRQIMGFRDLFLDSSIRGKDYYWRGWHDVDVEVSMSPSELIETGKAMDEQASNRTLGLSICQSAIVYLWDKLLITFSALMRCCSTMVVSIYAYCIANYQVLRSSSGEVTSPEPRSKHAAEACIHSPNCGKAPSSTNFGKFLFLECLHLFPSCLHIHIVKAAMPTRYLKVEDDRLEDGEEGSSEGFLTHYSKPDIQSKLSNWIKFGFTFLCGVLTTVVVLLAWKRPVHHEIDILRKLYPAFRIV